MVSISACHAEDPGSIPGRGVLQTLICFDIGAHITVPDGIIQEKHYYWKMIGQNIACRWNTYNFHAKRNGTGAGFDREKWCSTTLKQHKRKVPALSHLLTGMLPLNFMLYTPRSKAALVLCIRTQELFLTQRGHFCSSMCYLTHP